MDQINIDYFFPHNRIKTKRQILKILLETTRLMLISTPIRIQDIGGKPHFKVIIDKMSRLFFFNNQKYYTIYFPFTYVVDNGEISISYKNIVSINSKIISQLIEILNDSRFDSEHSLDFVEPISEIESEYDYKLWFLLKELLLIEDGYVRFDNDKESYLKAKKEKKEHTHPENHLDIFYTTGNTFKLGLNSLSKFDEFVDFLDLRTDCKYLKNHR
ncbi:hypothetical protein [Chryseobacterium scophthalmum]|uniref:hypothetical protein n=1 Tax=Chryseobacterium scophthalmum TaxID=59733 RepID=UPI003D03D0AA